jgi:hypothetical protein
MIPRKALTLALSVVGVFGLIFALLLISNPSPAASHASYAWKPGCHCGSPPKTTKPTVTTAKPTTTTAKPTTTTVKKTTTVTTAKVTTATTKKAATTTSNSAVAATAGKSTKLGASSTTSTSAGVKGKKKTAKAGLALAAAAATDSGSGGPAGGTGGTDGSTGGSQDQTTAGGGNGDGTPVNAIAAGGPPRYYISPVAIAFLLVYGVSFALYRTKRVRVTTHRKVWNVLLLTTFLICGLMGLVIAVGITRPTPWEVPAWLLVWHVETGIAMCFISVFHVGWHLRYYLAMITGKRRNKQTKAEPAVQKQRVARPQARRPLTPRTEAERMLALQRRQTARVESGSAVRPTLWTDPLAG